MQTLRFFLPLLVLSVLGCPQPTPVKPDDTDTDIDTELHDTGDPEAFCGDGKVNPGLGEVCDDKNNDYGDGCRGDCLGYELCGDGLVDNAVGEECDGGGIDDCDCDIYCVVPVVCGVECCRSGEYCTTVTNTPTDTGDTGINPKPVKEQRCVFGATEKITLSPTKSLWAAEMDDIWVGGTYGTIYRWEGVEWLDETLAYLDEGTITDMHGFFTVSGYFLWAASPQVGLARRDELGDWHPHTNMNLGGNNRYVVFGLDLTHAWAAGDYGTFNIWDGTDWSYEPQGDVYFRGLYAVDYDHVYGVGPKVFAGGDSSVIRWNGTSKTFSELHTVEDIELQAVYAADADHIWAVGEGGHIWYYDGFVWAQQDSHTTEILTSIEGKDADHVLIGGENGVLLRYDNGTWNQVFTTRTRDIDAIHSLTDGKNLLVLEDGWITRAIW